MQRLRSQKCAKCVKLSVLLLIVVFVCVQIVLMVFCFLKILDPVTFYTIIASFTLFIGLGLNANQTAVYFKLSGQPYKSYEHFQKTRQVGFACAIWTVAYIIKLIAVYEGQNLFYLSDTAVDIATACSLALNDFLTIVIPYYCVVDGSFIDTISGKHLVN